MILLRPVALLVIVLAAYLPGALILTLWRKRFADDPIEFAFAALSSGLLLIGWVALLLAEFGTFSLAVLALVWAAGTSSLAAIALRRGTFERFRRGSDVTWNRWEVVALAVWGMVGAIVYFRPHEFILGGADAGVYVNLGASIANTGGILIHDPLLGELDPLLRTALLRAMPSGEAAPYYLLPGLYVTGSPADLVTPQFFHLHPVWQAVGYALGGLRAELWITPLWGLLGCLAVYMTVRTLWGWRPAFLALTALSATALQVWFARYPTAEVLTQYLFWTGMWALIRWLDRREPARLWAALAGVAIGQVFLARIDTYALLAVPVILAGWFTVARTWRRDAAWFFVPLLLLALHSVLHGWFVSQPYFMLITRIGTRTLLRMLVPAAIVSLLVAVVAALWLRARPDWRALTGGKAVTFLLVLLRVLAVAVVVLALFAYFVRPVISQVRLNNYWYGGGQLPALDKENFVRLGWYLSPLGLAFGSAGIALMLLGEANRRTAVLLIVGCFFTLVFVARLGANPHQIYAMRRYVPQVLPFLTIGATYSLWWLWRRFHVRGRIPITALALAWILSIFAYGQTFITQVDYSGLASQIAALGRAFEEKSVILFDDASPVGVGDFVGTPLRFLEGKHVFVVRDTSQLDPALLREAVQQWQEQGYAVYWTETKNAASWRESGLQREAPLAYAIRTEMLEGSLDHKPLNVVSDEWDLSVSKILPSAQP